MRTPKGERLFDVIKSPVRGADGQIDHILTITRDMTEHRLAADKWRLASRVMEETGDAIVISDALDRILMVNPAFCRLQWHEPQRSNWTQCRADRTDAAARKAICKALTWR